MATSFHQRKAAAKLKRTHPQPTMLIHLRYFPGKLVLVGEASHRLLENTNVQNIKIKTHLSKYASVSHYSDLIIKALNATTLET